jgi:Transcriptional regulator PadR-like family
VLTIRLDGGEPPYKARRPHRRRAQISARAYICYHRSMSTEWPLTPLEVDVLAAGLKLMERGQAEFYGYALASHLEDGSGAYRRTGFSSLYRTLERLEARKFLTSRWDLTSPRPRRLYQLTEDAAQLVQRGVPVVQRLSPRLVIP